eukprot:scaffold93906_cov45-Prasinocladus_malaysianus.AAC.1
MDKTACLGNTFAITYRSDCCLAVGSPSFVNVAAEPAHGLQHVLISVRNSPPNASKQRMPFGDSPWNDKWARFK